MRNITTKVVSFFAVAAIGIASVTPAFAGYSYAQSGNNTVSYTSSYNTNYQSSYNSSSQRKSQTVYYPSQSRYSSYNVNTYENEDDTAYMMSYGSGYMQKPMYQRMMDYFHIQY